MIVVGMVDGEDDVGREKRSYTVGDLSLSEASVSRGAVSLDTHHLSSRVYEYLTN